MNIPAWTPPPLDEALGHAWQWNSVLALSGQAIPIGENGASLMFALTSPPAPGAWLCQLETTYGSILVHARVFPFRALFDVDLDCPDVGRLPGGLRRAMVEGIVASIGALVSHGDIASISVLADDITFSHDRRIATECQWFALRLTRPDGHPIEFDLCCPRSVAVRLLAGIEPAASPIQTVVAQRIRVAADFTLGAITVTYGELKALEPGTVVVLAERPQGTVWIRARGDMFAFDAAEEGRWLCTGRHQTESRGAEALRYDMGREGHMSDQAGTAAHETPPQQPVPEFALKITIDFDIGRIMVPLADVAGWREGAVIELDPPRSADSVPVTIRANGDVIGNGDIVRIDDRLAVRITRLLLKT